ncbi:Aquaporin-9 [Hondaea fermentalgiana]|uniref:Aquaporin-9 n=1 Tax=Hondaea fermentalgiana TaxID=2315210 RepID=A0A2R5FZW5_9STRA|nr:Aquaporin-9 [Hondaea fermentalgiana]|eukprot:GBG24280.1 Aquaporin-9 [Hondaea fermentalgiana]
MIDEQTQAGQGQQGAHVTPEAPEAVSMHIQANEKEVQSTKSSPATLQERYAAFIVGLRDDPTESPDEMRKPTFIRELIAEIIGCFFLIFFGCGMNASATLFGATAGLFQVGIIWGLTVTFAIWTTASVSGAHINPAVTFALALFRPDGFPAWKILPYWAAQLVGCILGAAVVLLLMSTSLEAFEETKGIVRGELGSELSASFLSMYFPNPGFVSADANWSTEHVNAAGSFGCEVLGTAILMFAVCSFNDARNQMRLSPGAAAFGVGMTIMLNVCIFAALNQACYNPARDLGPRIVAYGAGWGDIAFPGPKGGWWTYTIGPLVGAPIGAAIHDFVLMRGL